MVVQCVARQAGGAAGFVQACVFQVGRELVADGLQYQYGVDIGAQALVVNQVFGVVDVVGVVTRTADHGVCARAAIEGVIASATLQRVHTGFTL